MVLPLNILMEMNIGIKMENFTEKMVQLVNMLMEINLGI